jgi:uncharacterized protein
LYQKAICARDRLRDPVFWGVSEFFSFAGLGERRRGAKFALAVVEGVVREVYEIHSWHPAGSNHHTLRPVKDVLIPCCWEFLGKMASDDIRNKYVDCSVKEYLPAKAQNPIVYVSI